MNNNAWIIWNELVKTDCKITHMTIFVYYIPTDIYRNSLEINIKFENHNVIEKFSNFVFKKYGIDIRVDTLYNSFEIELKNSNPTHNINNCILENLKFPSNVESINIRNHLDINSLSNISNIKLFNLPENLHQLSISSSDVLFDLSNLPTSLYSLDISECEHKINLDYLPCGLKVLYLPQLPVILKDNFNYSYDLSDLSTLPYVLKDNNFIYYYNLSDLSNLPSSLIEINLGHVIFKSTDDLIKRFHEKIYLE